MGEYFVWEHNIDKTYTYSCEGCKYKVDNKCTRRPEMEGRPLPPPSKEPLCIVGKKA